MPNGKAIIKLELKFDQAEQDEGKREMRIPDSIHN